MVLGRPFLVWGGGEREMMEEKRDWWKVSQAIASWVMVVIVFVGVPTLRELYDGGYARWMLWAVVLLVLAAAGWLVWRFGAALWKLVKRAGEKLRDGYLWVLWRLVVRPARDYQGVEASNEAFDPGVKFTEELRPVLRELDDESLTLLGRALDRRKPGSREAFMEWRELRVEADAVDWPEEVKRLHEACERLRDVGAIEMWVGGTNMSERFPDLRVRFPVTGWSALERLRVPVEVELARRELVEGAAAPVRDGGMSTELTKALDKMPGPPLYTLDAILDEYDPIEGGACAGDSWRNRVLFRFLSERRKEEGSVSV